MRYFIFAVCVVGVLVGGCHKSEKADSTTAAMEESAGKKTYPLPDELKAFARRKQEQAIALAKEAKVKLPDAVGKFFKAIEAGDFAAVQKAYRELTANKKTNPWGTTPAWTPIMETYLAAELFGEGEPSYAFAFGREIIASIPAGSIYFGGTDPGRGLVTALCQAQEKGEPFFTLTQNALADNTYLHYVQGIYGGKINVLSDKDSQDAFNEYLTDAKDRLERHALKPGEEVKLDGGRAQVSGSLAVMKINGLLARKIFEQNPDKEFYVEESFPLDWMYPYLSPHELIMKLNHEPMESITPEMVAADEKFWTARADQMIGAWLRPETSVTEVGDFARKIFSEKDFSGFMGDKKFVEDDHATKAFSKLRSAIGGLYAWRAKHAKDPAEKERMTRAADFAYRQAYAFCPNSPEAVLR